MLPVLPVSEFCKFPIIGIGASPPPPLSGLAILLPAPPKLNPPVGEPSPRVLPALAASSRSFTADSWASNLREMLVMLLMYN